MKKLLLLLIIITAFISCKKGLDPIKHKDRLMSIILGKDTLQMYVSETRQLPLTISPSDYDTDSLKWNSSDSTILKISNKGLLSAIKVGTAKITVSNLENTLSVSALVTVNPKPIDSLKLGLLAYYQFNNNTADSSGKGNNGTAYNLTPATDRFGKANSAYQFDGASSYIEVKDNEALRLNGTDYSINYWVNLDTYSYTTGSAVLEKNSGPNQQGWNCGITGIAAPGTTINSVGVPFLNESGGSDPYAAGINAVTVKSWTMITIVYSFDDKSISIYENGQLDNVTTNIPTPNKFTSVDLFIGKNSYVDNTGQTPSYYIQGKLDDIRIYTRKLPKSDIKKLYNLNY